MDDPTAGTSVQRGGSTDLTRDELKWAIGQQITAHPRSRQAEIGPSEIGTPCARKLAHKLARTAPSNAQSPARSWRSTVGTAVHAWLANALEAHNERIGERRYLTEERVTVGEIDGTPLEGSCDVYDVMTATVIDWKVVGPATLKTARRSGPTSTYRIQTALYGRGFVRKGYPVDHVAVFYLPSAGDLTDGVWAVAPYDESVALGALDRANGIAVGLRLLGPGEIIAQMPTAEDYCNSCPFYRPYWDGDLSVACPGHGKTTDVDAILGIR